MRAPLERTARNSVADCQEVPADGISTADMNNGDFGTSPLFCRPLGQIIIYVTWGLRRQSAMAEEFKPIYFQCVQFDLEGLAATKKCP
jgi:hypothetical protein